MRILRWGHTTLLTEWREHDRGKLTKSKVMLSGLSLNEWMSNSVMKGLSSLLVAPCPEFGKCIIRRTAFS